ncbi:MAG: HAMP domain-containing histidine kinase [Bdellovibrionales bacterium]|nr:HAMP domain-containing histidine kinase [Bdellovibrionales bacterium]
MARIRNKVNLLTLGVAAAGIAGTIAVTTDTFVADKRDYIVEFNSIAAPNVAASIGKHLDHLENQFRVMDSAIAHVQRDSDSGGIIKDVFGSLEGVGRLSIYDGSGIVASMGSVSGPERAEVPRELMAELWDAKRRVLTQVPTPAAPRGHALVLANRVRSRLYLAQLAPDAFSEYFDAARAISAMLVAEDGNVLYKSGVHGGDVEILPNELLAALMMREKQAMLVKEVSTPDEGRILVAASPVPGTEGVLVVVKAPAAEALAMALQVLRSSLPLALAISIISVVLGVLFTRRLVQPIEELREATSRIAKGHWAVALPARTDDEIGGLVRAFNRMGAELEARETELKETHAQLVRSERLAAVGTLSAGIAHEVKNPLNSILGFAQLAEREVQTGSSPDLKQYVQFILNETRRAGKIITELLTYARQKPPTLSSASLGELLRSAKEMLDPQARAAGGEVAVAPGADSVSALVDRDQLYQVLSNLVINGVHAMEKNPAGQPRVVTMSGAREGDWAVIRVRDTGTGIPPELLPRIFEPFFSTKRVGEGTGLGLAMCQQIADSHGGRIEVTSNPGDGTEFRVYLRPG